MPRAISNDSIIWAVKHHAASHLPSGGAIVTRENGVYYSLNPFAARVWKLIEEPQTVEGLRTSLLKHCDVDPHDYARQLSAVLIDLLANGLIEVMEDHRHRDLFAAFPRIDTDDPNEPPTDVLGPGCEPDAS